MKDLNKPIRIQLAGQWRPTMVWLNNQILLPGHSQSIVNHSPDGFSWGYGGSGPAQLALAICLKVLFDDYVEIQLDENGVSYKTAHIHYQKFKEDFIAKLPQSDFEVELEFKPSDYLSHD